jgi:hypothetical protein
VIYGFPNYANLTNPADIAMPDNLGGIVFAGDDSGYSSSISRIDGNTGQTSWTYTSFVSQDSDQQTFVTQPLAVGTDGTVYTLSQTLVYSPDHSWWDWLPSHVLGLDVATGQPKFSLELPQDMYSTCNQLGHGPGGMGPVSVMPDGSATFEFVTLEESLLCQGGLTSTQKLYLMTLQGGGGLAQQTLGTSESTFNENQDGWVPYGPTPYVPGEVIPDGEGGSMASWGEYTTCANAQCLVMKDIGQVKIGHAGAIYTPPLTVYQYAGMQMAQMILGENHVAFASDGATIVALDINSGTSLWTAPYGGGSSPPMVAATAGGGLLVDETNRLVTYDSSGSPSYDLSPSTALANTGAQGTLTNTFVASNGFVANLFSNWTGYPWTSNDQMAMFSAAQPVDWAATPWAEPGNGGARSVASSIPVRVYKVVEANVSDDVISARVNSGISYWTGKHIPLVWDQSFQPAQSVDMCPANHSGCAQNDQDSIYEVTTQSAAQQYVLARFQHPTGIDIVFTLDLGALSNNGATIVNPSGSPFFSNVMLLKKNPLDVVPHELGHIFQLQHVGLNPLVSDRLMCGATSPFSYFWILSSCDTTTSRRLTVDEETRAKKYAATLVPKP